MDLDLVNNFIGNLTLDEKSMRLELFDRRKIDEVRNQIQGDFPGQHQDNYNIDMIPIDEPNLTYPDYTMSQPNSIPSLQPDFFKESL